jgi:riboflavin kinase/FMN adenylyltransferase
VYATEVLWESSTGKTRQFLSVTNIGVRPTFQDSSPSIWIETHLLDFDEDLYGEVLTVGFRGRIRDETKFASLEELKERIRLDIEAARKFFSTSRD